MPRSIAERIVRIESCSSVPPHIHPPIAQAPRPIREISIFVFPILRNSIPFLLSGLVGTALNRLNRLAGAVCLPDVDRDELACLQVTVDLDRVAAIVSKRYRDQFEMVGAH